MSPHRLARVSEQNEESIEHEDEDDLVGRKSSESTSSDKKRPARNPNQLHVTINTKPEDIECGDSISQHSNGTGGLGSRHNSVNRRPSVMMQEILSTRRPSTIMAAMCSPKKFVDKYRRGYNSLTF